MTSTLIVVMLNENYRNQIPPQSFTEELLLDPTMDFGWKFSVIMKH